jgi:hypothetical protein
VIGADGTDIRNIAVMVERAAGIVVSLSCCDASNVQGPEAEADPMRVQRTGSREVLPTVEEVTIAKSVATISLAQLSTSGELSSYAKSVSANTVP